jgi:hypothetical protein
MNIRLAKKMLSGIAYSQGRNKVSGRSVKSVTITEQDIVNMYNKQNGKCYWSGLSLDAKYNEIKHHPFAISPERLDNSLPYDTSNVVLCRRIFNLGRMAFPEKQFKETMDLLKEEFKGKQE